MRGTPSQAYYRAAGLNPELIDRLSAADHELDLPVRLPLAVQDDERTGWACHYGGVRELYRFAGGWGRQHPEFRATWQHGIVEPWRHQRYPLQLIYGVRHDLERLILVASNDQQQSLIRAGYRNVRVFGSPFAYARPQNLPRRVPGSRLYMPAHALDGAPFEQEAQMEAYCDFVAACHARSTAPAYVSLHLACLRNGQWWPGLLRRGIPIVAGADHRDALSYRRIWMLFSRFETISTSEVGSHVFYALAAGCNVVFEGPSVSYGLEQRLRDLSFQRALQNGEDFTADPLCRQESLAFQHRFRSPLSDPDLGRRCIGADHLWPAAEIRRLLGWSRRRWCVDRLGAAAGRLRGLRAAGRGSAAFRA